MAEEKIFRELAEQIYDFDTEVYELLGSSLGRVYNDNRDRNVDEITSLLMNREKGAEVRSELALIANMARTIPDKNVKSRVMLKYADMVQQILDLPTSFGAGDAMDPKMANMNVIDLKDRFGDDDHMIICISRAYGAAGNEIGFTLANELHMNFYDVAIMDEVLKRIESDENSEIEGGDFTKHGKRRPIRDFFKNFKAYHGLSKKDAEYFMTTKFILQMTKTEDFVVMGRCADAILCNYDIPHISIFVTAPTEARVHRIMDINENMSEKAARKYIKKHDRDHQRRYRFYTGRNWGKAANYDLCINSGTYGIRGGVDMIKRAMSMEEMI